MAQRIEGLRIDGKPFLGSVSRVARSPVQVNDQPSVDVITGAEQRGQLPSYMAERRLDLVVRIYHRLGGDEDLDDLVEMVEAVVRSDCTLGGLVIDITSNGVTTDEGWLAYDGLGPMAEVSFTARWEAMED